MPTADTSFLVALFNAQDAHHAEARRKASEAVEIVVPAPVLVEFLQVIHYGVRREEGDAEAGRAARRACKELGASATVRIEEAYGHEAAQALYLAQKRLTFVDAVAVTSAWSRKDVLLTFDTEQRRVHANR